MVARGEPPLQGGAGPPRRLNKLFSTFRTLGRLGALDLYGAGTRWVERDEQQKHPPFVVLLLRRSAGQDVT